MAISITELKAQFAEASHKKVEIEFAGDGGPTHDGKGRHNAESDAVRGNGSQFSFPSQNIDLHLSGSGVLTVVAKVSKTLLPDKIIGEGKVQVSGDGQQQVTLTDPKTGAQAGVVYFTVSRKQASGAVGATEGALGGAAAGRHGQGVTGYGTGAGQGQLGSLTGNQGTTGTGAGYGNQDQTGTGGQGAGYGTEGQLGSLTGNQGTTDYGNEGQTRTGGQGTGQQIGGGVGGGQTGQGYGQTGQGYGQEGQLQSGQQGGQQGYGGEQGFQQGGQQGYGGEQGFQQGGIGQQGGGGGGGPQEFHEKKSHNVSDHNESENYSRDVL